MSFYNKTILKLIDNNISIAIAESCTGGLISSYFTKIPGISKIFKMGLIVYSNESKKTLLKIPLRTIKKYGAVSNEISSLMLKNLYKISKCKICLSTTGIAGPTGGFKNKPVGLVYIGIKYGNKILIKKKIFSGKREEIQMKTLKYTLKNLKDLI